MNSTQSVTEWDEPILPARIEVTAAPNPFNSSTTITFDLPSADLVVLELKDINGRVMSRELMGMLPAGIHQTTIYAEDYPTGMYLVNLVTTTGLKASTRILLVR